MNRIFGAVLATTLAVLPSIAWGQDPGVSDKEIVIGAIAPFTGPAGPTGYAGILGIKIAVGEINDAGGVNGRKITFVSEDDGYVPARTVQAMQKLIDIDKVFALAAGSGAAHFLAILPTIEEQKIPVVTPFVAGVAPFEPVRRTVFGIGMSYRDGAYESMKVLTARNPGIKWTSIVQDDETGLEHEIGYKRAIGELKQTSVLEQRYKRGQTDFSSEVLRIKESGATGVFLGALAPNVAVILKEARKLDLKLTFGTTWLSHIPQAFDLYGEAGNGLVVYDYTPAIDGPMAAPLREMAKKYLEPSDQPKINRNAILGYAAMKVMANAMSRCGKELTRECTVKQIEGTKDFASNVMVPISFGPEAHLTKLNGTPLIIDFANKKFVPLN